MANFYGFLTNVSQKNYLDATDDVSQIVQKGADVAGRQIIAGSRLVGSGIAAVARKTPSVFGSAASGIGRASINAKNSPIMQAIGNKVAGACGYAAGKVGQFCKNNKSTILYASTAALTAHLTPAFIPVAVVSGAVHMYANYCLDSEVINMRKLREKRNVIGGFDAAIMATAAGVATNVALGGVFPLHAALALTPIFGAANIGCVTSMGVQKVLDRIVPEADKSAKAKNVERDDEIRKDYVFLANQEVEANEGLHEWELLEIEAGEKPVIGQVEVEDELDEHLEVEDELDEHLIDLR